MGSRRRFLTTIASGGLLTGSLLLGSASLAQDATPAQMADMGNCVTALGIGQEGDACVNVIHASPDAPAVDVYVNGTEALSDLAFGTASGWVALPAGEHQVQVTAADAAIDTAVIDATLELEAGAAYEVAATGLLADITPLVTQADLSEFSTADEPMARARVIHASPDAPAVDVAVTGGDVLIEDLPFPEASDYLVVPAAAYDLEVRPTGTTDVALALPGVALDEGVVYSIYAIGLAGDGSLTVLPVTATTVAPEATPTP